LHVDEISCTIPGGAFTRSARLEGALVKSGISVAIGIVGLLGLGLAPAWIAGTLGISASAAGQVLAAIQAGGWALVVVMAIFGGGIISAIIATVRALVVKRGKAVAIA
jgi:circularin A/uberolysin family circular bacteriocin